jgi:hypothetical protein
MNRENQDKPRQDNEVRIARRNLSGFVWDSEFEFRGETAELTWLDELCRRLMSATLQQNYYRNGFN